MLAASAAALPALLATAGCRSSDAFAGPDPLAGRPSLSPDVITLQAVITAEQAMIKLYQAAVNGGTAGDGPGTRPGRTAGPAPAASRAASGQAGPARGIAFCVAFCLAFRLASSFFCVARRGPRSGDGRAAARGRAHVGHDLLRRLVTVEPALAQLFASIAASDATHVVALGG